MVRRVLGLFFTMLSINMLTAQQDLTFGDSGKVVCRIQGSAMQPTDLIALKDGNFLAVAYTSNQKLGLIYKYSPKGKLISNFANNGVYKYVFNANGLGSIKKIVEMPDSSLLVLMVYSDGAYAESFVIKLDKNGTEDPDFGENGRILNISPFELSWCNDMIVEADRIVFVGAGRNVSNYYETFIFMYAHKIKGRSDPEFNKGNALIIDPPDSAVNILAFEKIGNNYFLAGHTYNSGINKLVFISVKNSGLLDSSYGKNGIKIIPNLYNFNFAKMRYYNSNFYILGSVICANSTQNNVKILAASMRYDLQGNMDKTYGFNGLDRDLPHVDSFNTLADVTITKQGHLVFHGTFMRKIDNEVFYILKNDNANTVLAPFNYRSTYKLKTNKSSYAARTAVLLKDETWVTQEEIYEKDSIVPGNKMRMVLKHFSTPYAFMKKNIQNPIQVFPNPARNKITILHAEKNQLTLYNMEGKKVFQTAINSAEYSLPTHHFTKGIYILKINNFTVLQKIE